jgi:FlaA1/EpsC-like NDP-sugar epimerase
VWEWAEGHRRLILVSLDVVVWSAAVIAATWLRFEVIPAAPEWRDVATAIAVVVAAHLTIAGLSRLYSGRHRLGAFDDALTVGIVTAAAAVVLQVVSVLWPSGRLLPLSVPFAAGTAAIIGTVGGRVLMRRIREEGRRPDEAERALIVGAGSVGTKLARDMITDPRSPYLPVAFVDDHPGKEHYRASGVRVLGTLDDVARLCEELEVDRVIIAVADSSSELVRRVNDQASRVGVKVKVVPTLRQLLASGVSIGDLRDVELADLLGRHQIDTDVESIAGYLTNRKVLVTGAGGSIGSELCRQISRFGPQELIMLDRDESALHGTQLSIHGRALLDTPDVVLADIRDSERLRRIFDERRPDVVFHAAALKHLPMLEQYPEEAWKTNVLGTLNVLDAARESGVGVFVNISTDKAANPTSVLGFSKRIAERLTSAVAHEAPGRYVSVRFGNVLGSRGSVLTSFAEQIDHGGPVTVTHPQVTRYFMTIPEAVQLVIQAAAIGRDGEALVLDMGEPVRIVDVAHQLIALSGRDVDIVFTGLRPGEKLHEDLLAPDETGTSPEHPLVQHVAVQRLPDADVERLRGQQVAMTSSVSEFRRWSEAH